MRTRLSIMSAGIGAAASLFAAQSCTADSLALDECIGAALRENPGARSASARVTAAQNAARQARSAYYPWVNVSAGYTRTDNAGQALFMLLNQRIMDFQTDINNPPDTENLRAGLSAQYRLLDGGQRGLDRQMADDGAMAAREALLATRNQLIHEISRGYHGVLQAREFAVVGRESVKSLEESLRVARERFDAGSTVKTDVLDLDVQLAQAREDLIRAQHGIELAVAALNAGIGRDMVTIDTALAASVGEPTPPPASNDLAAVEKRPELRATALMRRIHTNKLRKAHRDYFPNLNAFASLDSDSKSGSDWEQSYMAGVLAELNLFDGFRTRSAVAEGKAQLHAAEDDLDKARGDLRLDLIQAYLTLKDAWERMQVTRQGLAAAEEALRITRERYKQGSAEISILLNAQVGLTSMRTRNVAAQYEYQTALSNLSRARGELVERYATSAP